jgi:uncharacterized membrane protein
MTLYIIGFFILRLLVMAVIILGLVKLIVQLTKKCHCEKQNHRGETVLKERFASGEITEDEYNQKLKVLRS